MKKILFFISLLFAVVCYAAPPPDLVPDIVTDQSAFVVQDNQTATVYTLEAQEVAFVYLGDCYVYSNGSAAINYFLMLPEVDFTEGVIMYGKYLTNNYGYSPDKQNSNYGYPFGADYIS